VRLTESFAISRRKAILGVATGSLAAFAPPLAAHATASSQVTDEVVQRARDKKLSVDNALIRAQKDQLININDLDDVTACTERTADCCNTLKALRATDEKALKVKRQEAQGKRQLIATLDASEATPYVAEMQIIEKIGNRIEANVESIKEKQETYCATVYKRKRI